MIPNLYDLEMQTIEAMSRQQLLAAIRPHLDCLPPELRERLDEQPDGWLQLLVLATRLIRAVRMLRDQYWAERAAAPKSAGGRPHSVEQLPLGHQGFTADRSRGSNGSAPGAEP
jgi:hypothetical protein